MQDQRAADIAIEELQLGLSPREQLCDADHVAALAEVIDDVPPILVHVPTMRVIDGAHRVAAARSLGRERIRALLFEGDEVAAHVEAVRSNVAHGKPLTLAEREAAAVHIIELAPQWSDRRIAGVSGLSPKTVGRLRGRATVDPAQSRTRVGRDGRLRPVDPAEVRRRVAEVVRADPGASTRSIASRTGASQATVRDVRQRLSRGASELIGRPRRRKRKGGDEPADVADAVDVADIGDVAGDAEAPPAGAGTGSGVPDFATWFDQHRIEEVDWQRWVGSLPISRVYEVADVCRRNSAAWRAFAVALEDRARAHRRSGAQATIDRDTADRDPTRGPDPGPPAPATA